jgi:hypothetical protein
MILKINVISNESINESLAENQWQWHLNEEIESVMKYRNEISAISQWRKAK